MAKKNAKKSKKPLLKLTQKDLKAARGGTTYVEGGSGGEGYEGSTLTKSDPRDSILRSSQST